MKPDMGIFAVRWNQEKLCSLETTLDLKGTMNKTLFQLRFGSHMQKELQLTWKELGEAGVTVEILEVLPCSKDDNKTDYTEELHILRLLWEDRLREEGMRFL